MCGESRSRPLTIATPRVSSPKPRANRLKVVTAVRLPFLQQRTTFISSPSRVPGSKKTSKKHNSGREPPWHTRSQSKPSQPARVPGPALRTRSSKHRHSAPTPSSLILQYFIFIADPATTYQSSGPLLVGDLPSPCTSLPVGFLSPSTWEGGRIIPVLLRSQMTFF